MSYILQNSTCISMPTTLGHILSQWNRLRINNSVLQSRKSKKVENLHLNPILHGRFGVLKDFSLEVDNIWNLDQGGYTKSKSKVGMYENVILAMPLLPLRLHPASACRRLRRRGAMVASTSWGATDALRSSSFSYTLWWELYLTL